MKRDELTEEALMAAYVAGDGGAFDRLFAALAPRVYGFFMRTFNNQAIAHDLMQTTFLKVHRARKDYQSDRPLRPWLFAIAARVRVDELRKRVPGQTELLEDESLDAESPLHAEPTVSPEEHLDAQARQRKVQEALAALPESQRAIVHLHRFEGLSFAEIATALGTSEGAVKLRAFRAYERLRKQLRALAQPAPEGEPVPSASVRVSSAAALAGAGRPLAAAEPEEPAP
ncbi:MAG: sigma-70 family RNA polymerase sigma factor [Myxococcales bacterium]|nr:sigma-70 family RNA polymerase sigma factor [Myxococcales bacterium]